MNTTERTPTTNANPTEQYTIQPVGWTKGAPR
jgi:hypothetical protein